METSVGHVILWDGLFPDQSDLDCKEAWHNTLTYQERWLKISPKGETALILSLLWLSMKLNTIAASTILKHFVQPEEVSEALWSGILIH